MLVIKRWPYEIGSFRDFRLLSKPLQKSDRDPVDHFQLAKAQRRIEELTELVEKYKGDADKRALINEQLITDNENLSGLGP